MAGSSEDGEWNSPREQREALRKAVRRASGLSREVDEDSVPDGASYKPVTLEAHSLVFGDRGEDYGHPVDDFDRTAHYWTGHLADKLKPGCSVVGEDVGPMMCLLKLSRQCNKPKRDNLVDCAGYAETSERVIQERARRSRNKAREELDES